MADSPFETAGLWSPTLLAGRSLIQTPRHQITDVDFESSARTSGLTQRFDRSLGPDEGFPNRLRRIQIDLRYENIQNRATIEWLGRLEAVGRPFDLAVFKQTHDIFDADGERTEFFLCHRSAVPGVTPPMPYAEFMLRLIRWSGPCSDAGSTATELEVTPQTNATIDSGTPGADEAFIETDGRVVGSGFRTAKIRLGTAPESGFDRLEAIYVPYIKGIITKKTPRSYQAQGLEPRGYTIEEVG
jgi:hypothetical protein